MNARDAETIEMLYEVLYIFIYSPLSAPFCLEGCDQGLFSLKPNSAMLKLCHMDQNFLDRYMDCCDNCGMS